MTITTTQLPPGWRLIQGIGNWSARSVVLKRPAFTHPDQHKTHQTIIVRGIHVGALIYYLNLKVNLLSRRSRVSQLGHDKPTCSLAQEAITWSQSGMYASGVVLVGHAKRPEQLVTALFSK